MSIQYHCKRCASSYMKTNDSICPNCKYQLTEYVIEVDENDRYIKSPTEITLEIVNGEEFDEKYCKEQVLNYIKFAKGEIDSPIIKQNVQATPQYAPPQVICPKCGSTQIQAVTRKWSLLTGFLTNKIDRVCLNCKNKF